MQQATLQTASTLVITSLHYTGLIMTLEGCAVNSTPPDTPAAGTPTVAQPPPAPNPPMQKPLTADKSDPGKMGWMQGFPPSPDRIIRFDLAGSMFPRTRYGHSHMHEFAPARVMWHGDGPVSKLPHVERDISGILSTNPSGTRRTFTEALKPTYTDGILVVHRGRVIYERYFGAFDAYTQHIAVSITGSFVGTLATALVADDELDSATPVTQYMPELKNTACDDATVHQMMDMTVGVRYSENYADPNASVRACARAGGILPRPTGYKGPDNFYDHLATPRKEGEHDVGFAYETVNAETLAWIVRRASNRSLAVLLSERIWRPMDAQDDAYFSVGGIDTESGGGGLSITLHDLARFGEMIRSDGRFNDKQVLPKSMIDDTHRGGDPAKLTETSYTTLPGYPHHSMQWVPSNDHHMFKAHGIHGQRIYIDPVAQMTIVRYASYPIAANTANDPVTHRVYAALVECFMRYR